LARTYQAATTKLSDVLKLLESATDYKISGLSLTIDSVDQEVKAGFAMGANLQATVVRFILNSTKEDRTPRK
jgi:hypothetical protein